MNEQYYEYKLRSHIGEDFCEYLEAYNIIVAGGAITSIIMGEQINDIDCYFRSRDDLVGFVKEVDPKNSSHLKYFSSRSITFKPKKSDATIQLIYFDFYNNATNIFGDFDFTVNMGAYDFKKKEFIFHKDFFKDIATKKTSINKGTKFPLISLFRLFKYKDKGFDFQQKQLLELCKAINKFDYNDDKVVEDQTQGFYGIIDNYDKESFELKPDDMLWVIRDAVEVIKIKGDKLFDPVLWEILRPPDDYKDKVKIIDFKPIKVFKWVEKKDDCLRSFWKNSFEYKIGEEVKDNNHGIYIGPKKDSPMIYRNEDNAVLIEIIITSPEDIIDQNRIHGGIVTKIVEGIKTDKKKDKIDLPFD